MAMSIRPELPATGVSSSVMTSECLPLRHGQPVIGLGIGCNGDVDAAIGAAQQRARIERKRSSGIFRQNIALLVGGIERPEPRGRHGSRQLVTAFAGQALAVAVDGGGKGQPLGRSIKQLAGIGAVRLGVGIGLDRLRFRKGIP